MANLSIENYHWHLHESKYYVLVPGYQSASEPKKNKQKSFLLPSQCVKSKSNVKEVNMILRDRILG